MADEDLHSTDSSVSGEGHSTILLTHPRIFTRLILIYIFWFKVRAKLFSNAGLDAKLNKNAQRPYFVVQFAHFCIRPNKGREQQQQKVFVFLSNFEQLSLQKATFDIFWATFRGITGNVLGNPEQLVESPNTATLRSTFRFNLVSRNLGLFVQRVVATRTLARDCPTEFIVIILRFTCEGILSKGWSNIFFIIQCSVQSCKRNIVG